MRTVLASFKQKGYYEKDKSDNIDIIKQMITVSEMYRGNEEVVRADSLQQGEEISSVKWFLRGRLEFSDLVDEVGEQKANRVQQNAANLRVAVENGTPWLKILEQLDEK